MKNSDYKIKFQACNLCDALHRNINDDFKNVSFEINKNNDIQVKIILKTHVEKYREVIEDISVEFSALQSKDCVKPFIIELIKEDSLPLEHIVYNQKE